jgi:hypothetical protein
MSFNINVNENFLTIGNDYISKFQSIQRTTTIVESDFIETSKMSTKLISVETLPRKNSCTVLTCFKFKEYKPIVSWNILDIQDDISGSSSCVNFEYTGGNFFIYVYFNSSNPGGILHLIDLAGGSGNDIQTHTILPFTTGYSIMITNPCTNNWMVYYE